MSCQLLAPMFFFYSSESKMLLRRNAGEAEIILKSLTANIRNNKAILENSYGTFVLCVVTLASKHPIPGRRAYTT